VCHHRFACPGAVARRGGVGDPTAQLPARAVQSQHPLESAIQPDKVRHTVTLPIYKGVSGDKRVWFLLTDTACDTRGRKRFL
jgi:hypothetical protein